MNKCLSISRMKYIPTFRFFGMVREGKYNKLINPFSLTLVKEPQMAIALQQLQAYPIFMIHLRNYAKKAQGKMAKGGVKQKTVNLSEEEMAHCIDIGQYKHDLQMIKEKLLKDFAEHLTLRSTASQINTITVKLEGEAYPLNELAQISKKGQNLIALNMSQFPEALKPAIQAIIESGSGFNPQQDGTMIYLSVPKLTREHRENLAKNAKSIFIKAKDEIRNVQNYFVREAKKQTDLSEDLVFNTSNQVMAMAQQTTAELENIMKTKQKDLVGDS